MVFFDNIMNRLPFWKLGYRDHLTKQYKNSKKKNKNKAY